MAPTPARPAPRKRERAAAVERQIALNSQGPLVEVRRSRRRRRTVSAYRDGETTVVLVPATMSRADEAHWVEVMVGRLAARERRAKPTDADLAARAARLSATYLDGLAQPVSVRWVDNQAARWGSCTPSDRSIRLSSRLRGMPAWVRDYVLVHELTHLVEADHSSAFWSLVARYPRAERARGFLDGVAYGLRRAADGGGRDDDSINDDDSADEMDEADERIDDRHDGVD